MSVPATNDVPKSLDEKLRRLLTDPGCRDFILADAKDADMAYGLAAPGQRLTGDGGRGPFRSMREYRDQVRELVAQGLVDVMLMSCSTSFQLAVEMRLFDGSAVTPAVRMNDTTDIWLAAGSATYSLQGPLPFATTSIAHARWGCLEPPPDSRPAVDLGLFSITLAGDATLDRAMLTAYREFRLEAERAGFRHFLEVFPPNVPGRGPADVPRFLADSIVRALAGVPRAGRPLFLKIPYLGPRITEMLVAYDPGLVVGVLGGGSGTTHDAFALVAEARRHGARAAIFGRKINAAEHQPTFLRHLRAVADGDLEPAAGVRAYHGALAALRIPSQRTLDDDLVRTAT